MYRLTQTDGLTDVQQDILGTVRAFVDAEIIRSRASSIVLIPTRSGLWPG